MPTITGLSEAVSANDADLLPVVQGGETKQISADKISALKAIGEGQAYTSKNSNLLSVNYTNETNKSILVIFSAINNSQAIPIDVTVDSFTFRLTDCPQNLTAGGSFIVQSGSTYSINCNATNFTWVEVK